MARQALPQSSLTRTKQLFWFITREVADDYQLMPIYEESLSKINYLPDDWKALATLIAEKLAISRVFNQKRVLLRIGLLNF